MAEESPCLHEVLHPLDKSIFQSYHSNSFVGLLQLQGKFDFFFREIFPRNQLAFKNGIHAKSALVLEMQI